jgi:hypothetical protein
MAVVRDNYILMSSCFYAFVIFKCVRDGLQPTREILSYKNFDAAFNVSSYGLLFAMVKRIGQHFLYEALLGKC